MPRVAPIVRSTRYEHDINTLVAKRAEISCLFRFRGADLADQLQHIDAVLVILATRATLPRSCHCTASLAGSGVASFTG